jgi:hypothetical protein
MSPAKKLFCAAVSSLSLAACASGYQPTPVERNTAIGAGLGALAGAAISDDDAEGAAIGALAGAAIGAYTGCRQQGGCFVGGKQVAARDELRYDSAARRYYYVDPQTGRTYWETGEQRG